MCLLSCLGTPSFTITESWCRILLSCFFEGASSSRHPTFPQVIKFLSICFHMKPDDLAWTYGMQISDMKDAPGWWSHMAEKSSHKRVTPNDMHQRVSIGDLGPIKKCNHRNGAVSGMMWITNHVYWNFGSNIEKRYLSLSVFVAIGQRDSNQNMGQCFTVCTSDFR